MRKNPTCLVQNVTITDLLTAWHHFWRTIKLFKFKYIVILSNREKLVQIASPRQTSKYVPRHVHRWELPGNYPVFTVVMVIYHYVERICTFLLPLFFNIIYMIINIYYLGEPVNIRMQSLINIIQENNWVITPKKG